MRKRGKEGIKDKIIIIIIIIIIKKTNEGALCGTTFFLLCVCVCVCVCIVFHWVQFPKEFLNQKMIKKMAKSFVEKTKNTPPFSNYKLY